MPEEPKPHTVKVLEHMTFDDLMSIEELGGPPGIPPSEYSLWRKANPHERYFRSLVRAYKPAISRGVFGGHVLAQSCYAASKTVPNGKICHVS